MQLELGGSIIPLKLVLTFSIYILPSEHETLHTTPPKPQRSHNGSPCRVPLRVYRKCVPGHPKVIEICQERRSAGIHHSRQPLYRSTRFSRLCYLPSLTCKSQSCYLNKASPPASSILDRESRGTTAVDEKSILSALQLTRD